MKKIPRRTPDPQPVFASPAQPVPPFRVTHASSSTPRVSGSYYDSLLKSARVLLYIPVMVGQSIQRNIFPSILFTEGYHVFRQNFGFSREKIINNFLLGGMVLCTASKFYVNPWFTKEHEAVDAAWLQMGNRSIPDAEYDAWFNGALWDFTKALSTLVSTEVVNKTLLCLLNGTITFQRQYEFVKEWMSNYSAYGINAGNKSSGTEADNEKANLNPVQLFHDIGNQNLLPSLWNSWINTSVDFGIVCYTLFTDSPEITLPLYFFTVILPRFLVISVGYSFIFNMLLSFFEGPAQILHQKLNQLSDRIIRQITNIDNNAELIALLDGEDFEGEKLLKLLNQKRHQSVKHDLLDCGKDFIISFIKNFEWLFPILASKGDVRSGNMRQEEVGPYMMHFFRINAFLTWCKNNFEQLDEIQESIRRLALYAERLQAWAIKREEIEKKVIDSDKISFSGSVFSDEKHENLLARGSFTLEPGSVTHFDASSGSGKTTLFRIFRRVWGDFDGKCTVPKQKTAFLPSHVYILGADEPLFQTICYPVNHEELKSRMGMVKGWLKELNLPMHVYDSLLKLPLSGDKKANSNTIFDWMTSLSDGERKRIAICNILLKLHTQDISFLIMDEPFKGIDFKTQKVVAGLLKGAIRKSKCTALFSNHEHNHHLNTHTLAIDEGTREYEMQKKKEKKA